MNFTITTLESNTDGGVLVVHWRVSKASGEHDASSYGTVSYTPDESAEGYVAYDSLTEETVIGWIQKSLDIESLEAALDADLQEQSNPTVIVGKPF
jgi:hypothetical protein